LSKELWVSDIRELGGGYVTQSTEINRIMVSYH
jgi:hypothetical protein